MKKYPIAVWMMVWILTACNLVPSPVSSEKINRQNIQIVNETRSAASQPSYQEKVTFPDMVKTTPMTAPEPLELDEISSLLKAFQAENGDFTTTSEKKKEPKAAPNPEPRRDEDKSHENKGAFVLEFKSKEAKGKRQIRIPETGAFKVVLEVGPRFEISDKDATDGEAKIQMPAATLKTWIHLEEAKDNSSLEVSDELYYVQDTLSKERKQKHHDNKQAKQWFKLGLRPMPVPSDWHSPDGQTFVLRFKAQQIKEFQMIWQKQREEAPFPPGINRIGPEGGVVELPGVAKLTLGSYLGDDGQVKKALNSTTTLVIRQVHSIISEKAAEIGLFKYVGPAIQIFPQNLDISGLAELQLALDMELLKGTDPGSLGYTSLIQENPPQWNGLIRITEGILKFRFEDTFRVKNTAGIIVPISNRYVIENKHLFKIKSFKTQSFQIKQARQGQIHEFLNVSIFFGDNYENILSAVDIAWGSALEVMMGYDGGKPEVPHVPVPELPICQYRQEWPHPQREAKPAVQGLPASVRRGPGQDLHLGRKARNRRSLAAREALAGRHLSRPANLRKLAA